MRLNVRFLAEFLLLAAALFALWSFAGLGDAYGRLVVSVSDPAIRAVTGFQVTRVLPQPAGLDVFIGRGGEEGKVPLQPREMFSGLLPFLALLGASAGVPLGRRLRAAVIGVGIFFVFHVGLMLLGVYFTGGPQGDWPKAWIKPLNSLIDVVYGFYGLVGFAALPFLLWFWLTRDPNARPAA